MSRTFLSTVEVGSRNQVYVILQSFPNRESLKENEFAVSCGIGTTDLQTEAVGILFLADLAEVIKHNYFGLLDIQYIDI